MIWLALIVVAALVVGLCLVAVLGQPEINCELSERDIHRPGGA